MLILLNTSDTFLFTVSFVSSLAQLFLFVLFPAYCFILVSVLLVLFATENIFEWYSLYLNSEEFESLVGRIVVVVQ